MAERRMFAKSIIDSDAFLDMPLSAQALYFHLGMRADDDGFVNSPRRIMRLINCSDDDMKLLIAKNFVIIFDNGIVVIKHWRIHNYIRSDRYKPSAYTEEKSLLTVKENGSYTLADTIGIPSDIPMGDVGKVRIGKDSLGKDSQGKRGRFTPPTLSEVQNYIEENGYHINAERFVNFYGSKNWMVGKNKMSDWHKALGGWEADWKAEHRETTDSKFAQEADDILDGIL